MQNHREYLLIKTLENKKKHFLILGLKLECHAVTGWEREAESAGVSEPSETDRSVKAFWVCV